MSAAADYAWKDRAETNALVQMERREAAREVHDKVIDLSMNFEVGECLNAVWWPRECETTVQISCRAPQRVVEHVAKGLGIDLSAEPYRDWGAGGERYRSWKAPHLDLTVVTTRSREDKAGRWAA